MTRMELLQNVAKYCSILSAELNILNANNELSINIHAESVFQEALNIVYDLQLRNLNATDKGNFAAIDLLDDTNPGKKVAFQITSTSSIEKIKDCIEKYFRRGVYKMADELNVYILMAKQKSYSQKVIDAKIDREIKMLIEKGEIKKSSDVHFSFTNNNIFDHIDLRAKLDRDNDYDKMVAVEQCLRKQCEKIEQRNNLIPYYRKLKNMVHEVVMDDENGMTLRDIYTEPSFSILHTAFHAQDERFDKKGRQKFCSVDRRYKIYEFIADTFNGDNCLQLKNDYRFVLMLGYPGQGKSSFCKVMLNKYIEGGNNNRKPIFYFQLRNIRKAKEFISDPMSVLYNEACEQTGEMLERFVLNTSVLVLDGLDELYMRDNLKLDEIDRLCIELARAIEKFPDLQILLTSRYGYVNDETLLREDILMLQLSKFDEGLQQEWVSKYRLYHPGSWMTASKIQLFNSDQHYLHIQELIEQPLLLHMVASVKNEVNQQTNREMLYGQLFSELIERKYAKEGQLEILQNISEEDLRELIREVAFAIYKSGNEYITRTDLLKQAASKKYLDRLPQQSFGDSIKGIMISFYFKEVEKNTNDDFLVDRHNYAIEFLHKSLREYMTAEKIFTTLVEKFLEKRPNGRYILEDSKEALRVINHLFGVVKVTDEVMGHLEGIIKNTVNLDKKELVDRLFSFLNDFIASDFHSGYEMNDYPLVMDYCMNSFYGYWSFASCLGLHKNYLTNMENKHRLADYLEIVSSMYNDSLIFWDFSFQDFSNINFQNLEFSNCIFHSTIFSNCGFSNCHFVECNLININMERVSLNDTRFWGCLILGANLSYGSWQKIEINDTDFHDVNFADTVIIELTVENGPRRNIEIFSNCKFDRVRMDDSSYDSLEFYIPKIEEWPIRKIDQHIDESPSIKRTEETVPDIIPEDYKRLIL